MDTATFLKSVLAPDGWYCTLALREGKRVQKFYSTIEALQAAAVNFDEEGFDAYFALATFQDGTARTTENIAHLRAFFLDLDCGPGKDYPDKGEALKALKAFGSMNNLPKPTIVDSGHGVHVYWRLEEAVSYDDWLPVANNLKALAKQQGFASDGNVTADGARVLRVPGTTNYKRETVSPVVVLVEGVVTDFESFKSLLPAVAPANAYVPSSKDSAMMDAIMGNRINHFRTIYKKTLRGNGCAQIAYIFQNRETLSEPMWRAGLSIASFCEDRVKAAEMISKGHPDFDMDDTMQKMDRIKGPYLCERFDDYNPGVCQDCPLWGKIKSPIVLGGEVKEADPDAEVVVQEEAPDGSQVATVDRIPKYPKPFFRGANGGVYKKDKDEEGEPFDRLIYINDLYVVSRLKDPEAGEVLIMRLHMTHDPVQEFMVRLSDATSKEELRKVLSKQGVALYGKQLDGIMEYTQAWINELQQTVQAENAMRQFGWTDDNLSSFIIGSRRVYADRIEKNAPSVSTAELMPFFKQRGDFHAWRTAMEFWNRPGMELHQFVVCAGFGAPLMKLTPHNAALIHLWSKGSGYGKSTVQYAAAGIWGNPKRVVMQLKDTYNTQMNRAEIYKNIPVIMDEVTNMKAMEASDLIYQSTQGQQRNRMAASSNVERYRGDPWGTLFITSGNMSIIDKVTITKSMPLGEAMRTIEIHVKRVVDKMNIPKHESDALNDAILENYGHAGPIFVQYIMSHQEEVRQLLKKVQATIDKRAELDAQTRFWSAAAAVIVVAAVICKQIGLLQYDPQNLMNYIIKTIIPNAKASVKEQSNDPRTIINDYVYENWGKILQIKSTIDRRGLHMSGADQLVVPDALPKGDIIGRYEPDTEMLFLRPGPLRHWLAERQLNYQSLSNDWKRLFGAERKSMRLTRGTHMNMPPAQTLCMRINLENPDDAGDDVAVSDA